MLGRNELIDERNRIQRLHDESLALGEKYQKAIAGIDALLDLLPPTVELKPKSNGQPAPKGPVTNRVLAAIGEMKADHGFTLRDIEEAIHSDSIDGESTTPKAISTILRNLAEQSVIAIVRQGVGRRATTYKRVADEANSEEIAA